MEPAGIQMVVPSLISFVTLDKLLIYKMGMIIVYYAFSYSIFVDYMNTYTQAS